LAHLPENAQTQHRYTNKVVTTHKNILRRPPCPRLAEESRQSSIFQKSVTGECWNVFIRMTILLMKIVLKMIGHGIYESSRAFLQQALLSVMWFLLQIKRGEKISFAREKRRMDHGLVVGHCQQSGMIHFRLIRS
jgi:hypothetical protein